MRLLGSAIGLKTTHGCGCADAAGFRVCEQGGR